MEMSSGKSCGHGGIMRGPGKLGLLVWFFRQGSWSFYVPALGMPVFPFLLLWVLWVPHIVGDAHCRHRLGAVDTILSCCCCLRPPLLDSNMALPMAVGDMAGLAAVLVAITPALPQKPRHVGSPTSRERR